jgi:hypothetical protein
MCQKWIKYGKRFGYPECCIEAFLIRNEDDDNIIPPNRVQKRVGNGTGFIPCSYCSWKVISGKCKLEDLLKNRKERVKFPQSSLDVVYFPKK